MLSVVWQAQRRALCSLEDGLELLEAAETLVGQTVPIQSLWREALVVSAENEVSPHDGLFVVLAEREGCPLVSFERGLKRPFPAVVRRPGELA
jgi:predicted nucleic acid-binding protein